MSVNTRFLFEVTPIHSTRRMYDDVLYPDGFAYKKLMTPRQVIDVLHTANYVKITAADGKMYQVSEKNIYDVAALIEAGGTPDLPVADPGVYTVASYVSECDPDGEFATKMISEFGNIKIENGVIRGVLNYMPAWDYIPNAPASPPAGEAGTQNTLLIPFAGGYYLPLTFACDDDDVEATAMIVGTTEVIPMTLNQATVFYLGATADIAAKKIVKIMLTVTEGDVSTTTEMFLKFATTLTLNAPLVATYAGEEVVVPEPEEEDDDETTEEPAEETPSGETGTGEGEAVG